MADRNPVKATIVSGAATGLAEFATGDTVGISAGGTGATTVAGIKTTLSISTVTDDSVKVSAFLAHKSGTSQSIASGSFVQLTFSAKAFDVNSNFASNAWTPPGGRPVVISGNAVFNASGGTRILSIYKNGNEYARGDQTSATAMGVTAVDLPSGTDVYTLWAFQDSGLPATISGLSPETRFSGTRV